MPELILPLFFTVLFPSRSMVGVWMAPKPMYSPSTSFISSKASLPNLLLLCHFAIFSPIPWPFFFLLYPKQPSVCRYSNHNSWSFQKVSKRKSMFWNFKRSYWDRLLKSLSHASFPEYSPYGSTFILDQVQGYSDVVACLSNNKLLCTLLCVDRCRWNWWKWKSWKTIIIN